MHPVLLLDGKSDVGKGMELAWWEWRLLLLGVYLVAAPAVVAVMWLILRDRDV